MDPNLFYLDWERTFEVLVSIVVLAFLLERALALLFEYRFFVDYFEGKGVKTPIAFVVASAVCWLWDFDAISTIFLKESTIAMGYILTGAIVAGGSKASLKLFRDVMGVQSRASKLKAAAEKQNGGPSEG